MQSVFDDTVTLRRFRHLKRHHRGCMVECGMLELSQSSIYGAQVAWQLNESSPMTPRHGTWKQCFVEPQLGQQSDERIQYLWVSFNSRWPERDLLKVASFVSNDFGGSFAGFDHFGDEVQATLCNDEEWQSGDKPSPSAPPADGDAFVS